MFNENVRNIAKFDFKSAIKSKGFIILNIVIFVLSIIMVNFSTILEFIKSSGIIPDKDYNMILYDETGLAYENFIDASEYGILSIEKTNEFITYEDKTEKDIEKTYLGVNIVKSEEQIFEVQIISKDSISTKTIDYISSILTKLRNKMVLDQFNMQESDLALYKETVNLNKIILSQDKDSSATMYFANMMLVYVIFMIIMLVSNGLVVNIASEKTSKSTEYILSTVQTKDYLNGKILSSNLKSIFTIALLVFYIITALLINQVFSKTSDGSILENIAINNLQNSELQDEAVGPIEDNATEKITFGKIITCVVITLVFFIVTLTMFCYIEAGFVAKVKNTSEVESAITLPMIILLILVFVGMYSTEFNATITNILSFVPMLSLTILPMAYLSGKVSILVVIISLCIQVIITYIVCKVVNKKFKKDILDLNDIKQNKKSKFDDSIMEQETIKVRKQEIGNFVMCVSIALIIAIVLGNVLSIIKFVLVDISSTLSTFIDAVIFACYMGVPALILKHMLNLNKKGKNKVKTTLEEVDKTRREKLIFYLFGILALIVVQVINTVVVSLFNIKSGLVQNTILCDNTFLGVIAVILYLAVLPAIFEELLFRKVMLSGAKRYGTKFAIIFTSLAFGLFHANPEQIIGATFMGLIFSYVTIRTGDIKVAMWLHFTNNLFSALQYFSNLPIGFISFMSMFALVVVFAILGLVMLITKLRKDRDFFKLPEVLNKKFEFNQSYFVISFYGIILLLEILFTCIFIL